MKKKAVTFAECEVSKSTIISPFKKKLMKQCIIRAGLILLLACPFVTNAQQFSAKDAVTQTVAGFTDAWNHHDMTAFGLLFAPDADFINVNAKWDKGRAAIVKHHAWSHGAISKTDSAGPMRYYGMFRNSTMTFDSIVVRMVRPDVAIAHVLWRLTGDARTPKPRTGMFTFAVVKNNGKWQITAAQNTEINRTVH